MLATPLLLALLGAAPVTTSVAFSATASPADTAWLESTEFVDQDIRDVLRAVARAHGLNIFPTPEVKGKITLSLHRMPVMQALRNIVGMLGFEIVAENGALQVRPAQLRGSGSISMGVSSISLVVESQELRRFADDYASRTGLNILVDRAAKGTVSGRLHNIDPIDGLRALLASNGFSLRAQGEAWIVVADDVRASGGSSMGPSRSRLEISNRRGLVSAQLRNAPLADVLQQLLEGSGYSMVCYGQLGGSVDATFRSLPALKAVELVLQGTSYTFAIRDSTLLVGDRNPAGPSGQVLATTEMIHLRHMRVDKVLPLVPRTLASVALQAVPELNALIVSGSIEQIEKVRDFLTKVDQEVPQVVIEAVIVEFTRGNTSELGIKNGNKAPDTSLTGPLAALNIGLSGIKGESFSLNGFKVGTIGLLPQSFMLQLSALEGANQARVLARPRITTLNGQAASINVGTTDYFQVTTSNTNGVVTSDYRTFNSGITLGITPFVTKSGQITAEIKPEIRTPTSAVTSDANRPPSTSTRSISANVRLKDGETLVLGGLIQNLDLTTKTGVPILSAIPLIGNLFTYRNTQKTTSELAVFITPHLVDNDQELDIGKALDTMDRRVNGMTLDRLLGRKTSELPHAVGVPLEPRRPASDSVPDTTPSPKAPRKESASPAARQQPIQVQTIPAELPSETAKGPSSSAAVQLSPPVSAIPSVLEMTSPPPPSPTESDSTAPNSNMPALPEIPPGTMGISAP